MLLSVTLRCHPLLFTVLTVLVLDSEVYISVNALVFIASRKFTEVAGRVNFL